MNKKTKSSGMIAAVVLLILGSGSWRAAWTDSSLEAVRASSHRIDSVLHELTHAVQQAQGSSGSAKTTGASQTVSASRSRMETAGRIQTLTDQLLGQTPELERIYRDRNLAEGIGYMNTISSEARKIKDLTQSLGPSPGSSETAEYYRRVSERLRHINRAKDDHDKWMDVLSISWPSGQAKAGDPDRPLVAGRIYNASGSSPANDHPTESIALNYSKIQLHSASIDRIYEYGDLVFLLDSAGNAYSLPDGVYSGVKGDRVEIKGKKILQNYTETESQSSGMATGRRTYEPILLGNSDRGQSTAASGRRSIYPVRFAIKSAEGRYTASGSWFELKGGTIASVGGILYKHNSLPFVPIKFR